MAEDKAKRAKRFIVIGGGAAGFFCAVNAARCLPGATVIILEKSSKLLSKVKVSGGGRCNVTHDCTDVDELVAYYPRGGRFLKKAFHQFGPKDMIHWLKERGVALHTEADGRMFPVSNDSQTIIDCFLREAEKYRVGIVTQAAVEQVTRGENGFTIRLADGKEYAADAVCIACGGNAGAAVQEWLRSFGHTIVPPVPSLFTFNLPKDPITRLMGISVPEVVIRIPQLKLEEKGPLLITHWGLSGPAVLRISAWGARSLAAADWSFSAFVNWLPEQDENSLRELFQSYREAMPAVLVNGRNPFGLPARLWEYLLQRSGITENVRWGDLKAVNRNALVKCCCSYQIQVTGKTTFKEEFVTAGGVTLSEIDPQTMESKRAPGLFFAGEVMDVDGITGGFNFQHAWTSAWIAAQTATRCLREAGQS